MRKRTKEKGGVGRLLNEDSSLEVCFVLLGRVQARRRRLKKKVREAEKIEKGDELDLMSSFVKSYRGQGRAVERERSRKEESQQG